MRRIFAFVTAFILVSLCVTSSPATGQILGQTTPRLATFTSVVAGNSGADGLTYVNPRVLKTGLSGAGAPAQGAGTPGYLGVFTDSVNLGNSATVRAIRGPPLGAPREHHRLV